MRNIIGMPPSDGKRLVPHTPPTDERFEPNWSQILEIAAERRPDLVELKLILEADEQQIVIANNAGPPPTSSRRPPGHRPPEISNLHRKYIPVRNGRIPIDSSSLVPGAFFVMDVPDSAYRLDWVNGALFWVVWAGLKCLAGNGPRKGGSRSIPCARTSTSRSARRGRPTGLWESRCGSSRERSCPRRKRHPPGRRSPREARDTSQMRVMAQE